MANKTHSPLPWRQTPEMVIMSGTGKDLIAVAYASEEDGRLIVSTVNAIHEAKTCANCKHWRDKAWTDKGWGICDNPENEVKAGPVAMIRYYMKNDPKAAEELVLEVENGIRYPEDFGCIFFEPAK